MIRRASEGEITWFPGLVLSDIPQPLPKGIGIRARRNELGLDIQGLAGAIPLLNGDTLQIIPKIGRVNFLYLLFRAEGTLRDLEREYDAFVEYSVDNEQNVESIVARALILSLAEILGRSPKQGRVRCHREGLFAVGQVDAVATSLNIASRKREPVAFQVRERTLDIPENRVITEALVRAWHALATRDQVDTRMIRDKWLGRFPRSTCLGKDLEHVQRGFASARYGGPRDYYRKALMLSQIVLGSSGLGFDEAAIIQGDAILLNTSDVYEKYLRNVFSSAYSEAGYIVSKGGIGVRSLYLDGSYELQPDIVISKDGRTLIIADAKYKQPTAGDHYQMYVYLTASGIRNGLLLAPAFDAEEVIVKEYCTADKVIIREVFLPMSNLAATEDFIRTAIERFA